MRDALPGGAGEGGPGLPQSFEKNKHKSKKKGTLKFSSQYLAPLNNHRVVHALIMNIKVPQYHNF